MVGSNTGAEQTILAEIAAQHLEHRLGRPVERKLAFGSAAIIYQAIQAGQITVYPETTGTIQAVLLREQPGTEATVVWERTRAEMARVAQLEVFSPLGVDSSPVAVVSSTGDRSATPASISEAASGKGKWSIGVSFEFQERYDGLTLFNNYRLPQSVPVRAMDPGQLFPALEKGEVSMIVTPVTDGHLISPQWTALRDDKKVFPPHQTCLLARQESLNAAPALGPALAELSGKFTNEIMRKLNAQVDIEHRPVRDVAAEFLASAGLR